MSLSLSVQSFPLEIHCLHAYNNISNNFNGENISSITTNSYFIIIFFSKTLDNFKNILYYRGMKHVDCLPDQKHFDSNRHFSMISILAGIAIHFTNSNQLYSVQLKRPSRIKRFLLEIARIHHQSTTGGSNLIPFPSFTQQSSSYKEVSAPITEAFAASLIPFSPYWKFQQLMSQAFAPLLKTPAPLSKVFAPMLNASAPMLETFAPISKLSAPMSETFALMSETFARMAERFALMSETFAPMAERFALRSEAFAPMLERFALRWEAFAPMSERFALRSEAFAPMSEASALRSERFAAGFQSLIGAWKSHGFRKKMYPAQSRAPPVKTAV